MTTREWLKEKGSPVAALLLASVLIGGSIGFAARAKAEPVSGCESAPWGFLGSQVRGICDGMIQADGGWNRARVIMVPAHQVPFRCTYSRYSSSCSGGYFVDDRIISTEVYPVYPETVLPDEPGHLVGGA